MKKLRKLFHSDEFIELLRYGIFGCITTGVNLGLFFILKKIGLYYLLANSISYCIAVIINYLFNYKFVFNKNGKQDKHWNWVEFAKFFAVRMVSLLVDNALFYFVVDILHVNIYIGRIALSIIVIIATFIVNKLFVFKQ
jgi:putative flippase GtrA